MTGEYFYIHTDEDGLGIECVKDVDGFLNEVLAGDYGDVEFMDEFKTDLDPGWEDNKRQMVLIKGTVVVPKKVEVVTKYET